MERSLYTADTGRAGGAQIYVITKSGTSQFHGGVYEFFRNDALAANNFSNNANKVNVIDSANPMNNCTTNFTSTCAAKVPPLRWNDFGGTIGGPIYIPGKYNRDKNKTFFFYSQEDRRIITYTTFNPDPAHRRDVDRQFQPAGLHHGGLRRLPGRSRSGNPDPGQPDQPQCRGLHQGHLQQAEPGLRQHRGRHHRRLLRAAQSLQLRRTSRASIRRFNERFTVWGKFEIDQIPTTEPGGLFTGSTIPGGAITNTNSPGRSAGRARHQHHTAHPAQRSRLQLLAEPHHLHPGRPDGQGQQSRHQPRRAVRQHAGRGARPSA